MANQIKTKFYQDDSVKSEKILLENNTSLRGKDSADATQDLLKIDATDKLIVYRSTGAEEIAYMSDVDGGGTALNDHINDTADAHDASAISVVPTGNLAASDVQAALQELQGDLDGIDAAYVNIDGDTMTGDLLVSDGVNTSTLGAASLSTTGSLLLESIGDLTINAPYTNMGASIIRKDSLTDGSLAFGAGGIAVDIQGGSLPINMDTTADITLNDVTVGNSTGVYSPNGFKPNNTAGSGLTFSGLDNAAVTLTGTGVTLTSSADVDITAGAGNATVSASNNITLDANSGAGTIFADGTLDMGAHEIIDLSQVTGLNAATVSGNAVRWDEVGQYDMTAGYGIATLDSGGKIPAEQLPNSIMEYKGTWDASTNTPSLANGSPANLPEDAGHLYIVSVGGTVNFGAGNISFNAGDSVILSSGLIWEKSTTANLVTSVNTYQGVVTLAADDLAYQQNQTSDWDQIAVPDGSNIKVTLDNVGSRLTQAESDINAVEDDVSHLVTLSGVAVDSDNLGVFSGSTIANDQTVKAALQDLETAHEAHLNDSSDAHDASAISYVNTSSGMSATDAQGAVDELDARLDALEAVEWATPYKKTLIAGDITNGYIDLPFEAVETNGMSVFVDRLAIHQGAAEDYSLSVVSGVTRITFLNDMVNPSPQKLAAGDSIYVRYQRAV